MLNDNYKRETLRRNGGQCSKPAAVNLREFNGQFRFVLLVNECNIPRRSVLERKYTSHLISTMSFSADDASEQ